MINCSNEATRAINDANMKGSSCSCVDWYVVIIDETVVLFWFEDCMNHMKLKSYVQRWQQHHGLDLRSVIDKAKTGYTIICKLYMEQSNME
jgi:hypothetical protein